MKINGKHSAKKGAIMLQIGVSVLIVLSVNLHHFTSDFTLLGMSKDFILGLMTGVLIFASVYLITRLAGTLSE